VFDIIYNVNPDFFNVAIRSKSYVSYFGQASDGIRVGQWDLSLAKMKNIPFLVPPQEEQTQIVRFLDWKISEINKLIALHKRQISALKEYKEHKVTAKLSGEKVWLKWLLREPLQYGANSSGAAFGKELPRYIRITDIDSDGNLKTDGAKSILREEAAPYILADGDILLARSGATVGKAFFYKKEYGLAAYAGYLIRAKFDKTRLLPEYFMYFTNSSSYSDWKDTVFIQATIQNISADKYGRLPIPLPSIEQQKHIVEELDDICKNVDILIETRHKKIKSLQELKVKIISDVVTGKIDVRGIQIPEYEFVAESINEEIDEADCEEQEDET
jgi:type I restriction enzyme S subunit